MVLEPGTITGLVGRNGSGKTVLMKIICGFVVPDTGSVKVGGKLIGKDLDFPEDIGVIIENPTFISYKSGLKNLEFLAQIKKKIGKKEIMETLELVGLDPNMKKHVSKYSLGMRQRLGIAQAIMEDPELLILDEPMNGLDRHGVQDIRELLISMKEQGKTILIATHNHDDVELLCDHVFSIDAGMLSAQV
jgi:ABC-2 type transport system ATP-binding protein